MATENTADADLEVNFDEIDALVKADKAKKTSEAPKKAPKTPPAEEIEVEKTDETPPVVEKPVLTPDAGLEKLQKQLEDEKAARLAAENNARAAAEGERLARTEKQATELDLVVNAISTLTQSSDALEAKYAESLAAADYAGAAKVQRQMADNSAKLQRLEDGKAALERAPKPTVRAPVDQVDEYVNRIAPEFPRSRTWLRNHPEFVRDTHKNEEMIAAHQLALARGYKADTDEYFASIEKTLDIAKPAVTKTTNGDTDPGHEVEIDPTAEAAKPTATRRTAPPAAPPSRSGGGTGSKPNTVRLTAQEVEMAEMMDMSPEEYARNKVALQKEGKLN